MKVTFDENGYVNGWCMVGDNGGTELDVPEDFDSFLDNYEVFKLLDGKLVLDAEKLETDLAEQKKGALRERRETECFSVINRGWIWYSCLTLTQWRELRTWYLAWLNVTQTLTVPERPAWIDEVDASRIPLAPAGFV